MIAVKRYYKGRVVLRLANKSRGYLAVQVIVLGAMLTPWNGHTSELTPIEGKRPTYWGTVRDNGFVASITMQPTALPLDMNSGNSIEGETGDFKPATYLFGERVLKRQALSRIEKIYSVARVRRVPIVSSGGDWVIAEFFGAGAHIPKYRYKMLGKSVQTQYILNRSGHVVRIADIGWRTDVADARRSGDIRVHAGKHSTWIRVFDVSDTGDLHLIATAWVVGAGAHQSDGGPPAQKELSFGDENGKSMWANQRRFESALGLDFSAKTVAVSAH